MFSKLRSTWLALAVATVPVFPAFAASTVGTAPASPDVGQTYLVKAAYTGSLTSEPATPDVGQEGYPANTGQAVAVQTGRLLPPGSNGQGEPQSSNSLPSGFLDGTPAMAHRLALQRSWSGTGQ